MDTGDVIAVSEGVLLAGTWGYVLHAKRSWSGWREKSALSGFVCVSLAIASDLILTVVMHFRGESTFAAVFFMGTMAAGALLGIAGFILGILGKGTPRIAAVVWSCVTLIVIAATVLLMETQ